MRNALAHVPPEPRPAAVAVLKTIVAQDTAEAAHAQGRQVADTLRDRFPRLAELMDGACEDGLADMTFPRKHWAQIASTNPLERLNGEIKRRSDVIGIFPNERAEAPPTMLPISGGGRFWIGRALGRTMERGFAPAC